MNKDPAFLFYSSDFLTGTAELTNEELGQYIKFMCYQHQKGHLDKQTINRLIPNFSEYVLSKLDIDNENKYFSERLDKEIEKRRKHADKQRENGLKGGRPKTQIKTKINPNKTQIKPKRKPLEIENEIENVIVNIIEYLNEVTNSNFRTKADSNKDPIRARLNEGYKEEDLKKVIKVKNDEWKDTQWEKHLNPTTLFRPSNFERYLNQKNVIDKMPDWFDNEPTEARITEEEKKEIDKLLGSF